MGNKVDAAGTDQIWKVSFCAMEMKLREMRRPLAAHFLHSEVHRNGLHKETWNI